MVRQHHAALTNTNGGQTGVLKGATPGTWVAQIGSGTTRKYLGTFKTFEEAVSARKQAERARGVHKNHGKPKAKSY